MDPFWFGVLVALAAIGGIGALAFVLIAAFVLAAIWLS